MYALKDIVPPTYRKRIVSAAETGYAWASSGLSFSGKTLWVVSTSALLLGVPWALAFSEEQQVIEMEREMRMQQSANEVCSSEATLSDENGLANNLRSFLPLELVDRQARDRHCKIGKCEIRRSTVKVSALLRLYRYSACNIISALNAGTHDGYEATVMKHGAIATFHR